MDINNSKIVKIRHSTTFTTKIKWTILMTALLAIFLTSAISTPIQGQAKQNTLKVITQVVCPQGFTCPKPSAITMTVTGNNPTPSSFSGSSSGVDVTLGNGNFCLRCFLGDGNGYSAGWTVPATPTGLELFPGTSPHCTGSISGGQSLTCVVLFDYALNVNTAGDGIPDSWKGHGPNDGIPYMGVDGVLHYYKLPNATPLHKNLYVELDYMKFHLPALGVIGDVKKVFANAPVSNRDRVNGINLYVTFSDQIPHQNITTEADLVNNIKPHWFGNATERADPNHDSLLAAKSIVFRYAVFAHDQGGPFPGSSGVADDIPGMNFLVTLGGCWGPPSNPANCWSVDPNTGHSVGTRSEQAATFIHELGHNLGLRHGGNENLNCKTNYFSVMNYLFQFSNWVGTRPLDYSRSAVAVLDKMNLNEPTGIGQSTPPGLETIFGPTDQSTPPGFGPGFTKAGIPVDWNFDGQFTDKGLKSDINSGLSCGSIGPGQFLSGFDDWPNLIYLPSAHTQQQLRLQQVVGSQALVEQTGKIIVDSRTVLLEGITNAIEKLRSEPLSAQAAGIKEIVFEIQNLIAALKTEEPSSPSLSPAAAATATTSTSSITTSTTTGMTAIPTRSSPSPSSPPSLIHTISLSSSLSSLSSPAAAVSSPALLQNPTAGGAAGSVDTTHIAHLLNTNQLDAAIGELNKLLANVITLHLNQLQQQQHPQQQQLLQKQLQQQQQVPPQLPPGSNSRTNVGPSTAISNPSNNNNNNHNNNNSSVSSSITNPPSSTSSRLQQQQQQQQYPYNPYRSQYPPLPSNPYSAHQQLLSPQQQQQQQQLPFANPGISQTVYQSTKVVLDGRKSYDPNPGGGIVSYQWTQLPTSGGVPVTLIGSNTATPYFIAPKLAYDNTILAFSLRVMDNHGGISSNHAVVYMMVKHNTAATTTSSATAGGIVTSQQLQQPIPKGPIPGQPSIR